MNERSDLPDRDDAWRARAAEMLQAASPAFDPARSRARLEARIRAEREWAAATRRTDAPAARGRRSSWFVGGWGFALGAAAALAVVGLAPRGFWSGANEPALEALSGQASASSPADRVVFTLAFRPGVPLAEAGRLVMDAGGEFVGGPSALGLWRVSVPKADREAALGRLRASPFVEAVAVEP
jgi:hypothetical protein